MNIFHDLHDHAIIWFHHCNRYHRSVVDVRQLGWASKVSGNLFVYAACALGFAVIVRLLGCTFQLHPGCTPVRIMSEINLSGVFNVDALLKGFLVGFSLHHYFVDQFVWKTGRSEELRNGLRLTA